MPIQAPENWNLERLFFFVFQKCVKYLCTKSMYQDHSKSFIQGHKAINTQIQNCIYHRIAKEHLGKKIKCTELGKSIYNSNV